MPVDATVWWEIAQLVIKTCLNGQSLAPKAITVAGTSGTLLAIDQHGVPLCLALPYHDLSARAESEAIGAVATTYCAARGADSALARWLKRRRNGFREAPQICPQATWITGQLLGHPCATDENNALKLGYDPAARRWPSWLQRLEIPANELPAVVPPGTPLGTVHPDVAAELGLSPSTTVMAGTTDGIAAFIASGGEGAGTAVTSLGSTLVLRIVTDRPLACPEQGIYSHRLGSLWLTGGASNVGAAILRDFFADTEIERLSQGIDPQLPSGLDYYPLRGQGERFPINDAALQPRLTPRPPDSRHFLYGLLEGIARVEQLGYERLHELGAGYPRQILSVGGGATNSIWNAIRSRVLGVPVSVAVHTEASYGAALLAKRGTSP